MTRLTMISVGTLKEDYLARAVAEYEKRLSAYCRVENICLREERIANEEDATAVRAALEREGDAILSRIPEGAYTVALCVEGEMLTSEALAVRLSEGIDRTGRLCFIIGSSHGLSPRVKATAHLRLSVSRLTFPHQLLRALLPEMIYRSFTILHGKRYHK